MKKTNKVMRSGTNTIQPAKKLAFKRVGLFLVVIKIRPLVYKLIPKDVEKSTPSYQ